MENSDATLPDKHINIGNSNVLRNIMSSNKKNLSNMEASFLKFYVEILENSGKELALKYDNYKQCYLNMKELHKKHKLPK